MHYVHTLALQSFHTQRRRWFHLTPLVLALAVGQACTRRAGPRAEAV